MASMPDEKVYRMWFTVADAGALNYSDSSDELSILEYFAHKKKRTTQTATGVSRGRTPSCFSENRGCQEKSSPKWAPGALLTASRRAAKRCVRTAQVWVTADHGRQGFLGPAEFVKVKKLV